MQLMLKSISDEEPVSDATPLSPREINRLSGHLVENYSQIASLENLEEGMVANVRRDYMIHQMPLDKAKAILCMISKKRDFSRERLSDHLEEVGLKNLKDIVLNGSYRYDNVGSPGVSTNTTTTEN